MVKKLQIDAVIPALNEEDTVAKVVTVLKDADVFSNVIVVDNGSTDCTKDYAEKAGAIVLTCEQKGLGRAMKIGINYSKSDYILKTDADIDNWSKDWLEELFPIHKDCLTRIVFDSPYDTFPVTRLIVEPFLKKIRPDWQQIPKPISGTYAFARSAFEHAALYDDWAFDISLLCAALESNMEIKNINVGVLSDRPRDIFHYVPMASEITDFFIREYSSQLLRRTNA
jgi:glycosyltransferase involved in cell wall biosynthesis